MGVVSPSNKLSTSYLVMLQNNDYCAKDSRHGHKDYDPDEVDALLAQRLQAYADDKATTLHSLARQINQIEAKRHEALAKAQEAFARLKALQAQAHHLAELYDKELTKPLTKKQERLY